MKKKLKNAIMAIVLLLMPTLMFGQTPPNLGSASDFVLFTTVGAMTNTGISHLTGYVGANNGAVSGFGNVNGVMTYTAGALSAQCATDLLIAYGELNSQIPTLFPANGMGGNTLNSGVYSITGAATLTGTLTLDAQGVPGAVFIFQIQGPLSTAANSKIKLINGAQACNVFWKVEGLVDMATGTSMKGTIIANNAGINMNVGDTLEGRALSIAGAVDVDGVMAYTPVGCGSPTLLGPVAPTLLSANCYTIFSSNGAVTNAGTSLITGDVGTNVGLTTGFNPLDVIGTIHPIPDGSTTAAATDLLNAYTYINALPADIELLYPAQFGNNLVLTPHTYLMNGAVTFTDTVYLDAMGDSNAVFVIKTYGAFETSTYSKVILTNGTKPKNVYWLVSGAVTINDYSIFNGTIICNGGAMNLNTGAVINGRALTTTGIVQTAAITAIMPPGCFVPSSPIIIAEPANMTVCTGDSAIFVVDATGSDLTYQWRKGNVNLVNGARISGATSDTLVIFPVLISDTAYNYNVIINGSLAPADTSINVSLNVNTPPVITTEPINQIANVGNSVSFTVVATGSNLTYQWRKGNVNLVNGGSISNATTATLTINPANITNAASNYNVIVSGSCAPNDTSINVSLALNIAPIIITEPANMTVCTGDSAIFVVDATGSNLTYQWRKGNVNLVNGARISGATSDTLVIFPVLISDTAHNYNVIITGSLAPADTSINVSLNVNTPPIITTEPINQSACSGNSLSFSVVATGSNLTYQWRKGNVNLVNGLNITGANSATLNIYPATIADEALNYNVIVSGSCAPADTSNNVSLTISTAPVIVTAPVDKAVCVGDSVFFSVVATGSNLTYQWRKGNINLVNGGNISGATSDTLRINGVLMSDTAHNYNVIVGGGCSTLDTNVVALNMANEFGILAGTGISSTGFSVISNMNVGLSPGVRSSITGFPPATVVNGAVYASDDIAPPGVAAMLTQAKLDLTNAYLFAEGATAPAPATVAGDQGGLTLAPGIYKSTSTLLIQSGDLTLDAQGDPNATWIFQIASDFTTVGGAGGSVILAGGAQAKNITWQVGSSATIGNGTSFKGNILALTSITMNTGSSIEGKLLARNGAVVLSGTNLLNSPVDTLTNATSDSSLYVSLVVYPLPIANAGFDKTIIIGDSALIGTLPIIGNTYSWTPITDLSSAIIAQPYASPTDTTTYVLTVTSNHGCVATDTVIVNVNAFNGRPNALNDTINICENGGMFNVNVQNNDTDPEGGLLTTTIIDAPTNGVASLSGISINYTPNFGFSGIDTLTYIVCDNGTPSLCDTAYLFLVVNPLPIANAGIDQTIINGGSALIGTLPIIGNTYSWSPITDLSSAIIAQPSASPSDTTMYVLTVTSNHGCVATDTVIVNVNAFNGRPNALNDTLYICENGGMFNVNVQNNDTDPEGGLLTTTIIVAPTNGVAFLSGISINYTPNSGFSGIDSLTYIVCDNGTPSLCDTAFLFIHVNPIYSNTVSTSICSGDSILIAGLYRTVAGTYTETLNTVNGCDSIINTVLTLNPIYSTNVSVSICSGDSIFLAGAYRTTAGVYTDILASIHGCDSVVITSLNITLLPVASFSASMNDYTTYSFVNTSTNANSYLWNFGDGVTSIGINPIHIYEGAGSYSAMLIASNSCTSDTAIHILEVLCSTDFFNGFSPNGDGLNDYWNIPMLNCYPENSVLIINRWGSEVWEGINYDNNVVRWTGQNMNNNDLPDGTYYYIITYGGLEKRGWVFIKR